MPKFRRRDLVALGTVVLALALVIFIQPQTSALNITSFAECADAGYPITETDPQSCSYEHQTYLGPRSIPAPLNVVTSAPFDLLVEGDSRGQYPQRQQIFTTASGWTEYWRSVHAGLSTIPPILPVDFNHFNVIALNEGTKPTDGYGLKVTSITVTGQGTVVYVSETIPGGRCKVAATPTSPYFIAETPVLTPPVSFRVSSNDHQCSP